MPPPPAPRPRLLVVEDEPALRDTIQYALESEGGDVVCVGTGGDDYVTKPFSPRELAARVRAILRRVGPAPAPAAETHPPAFHHDPTRHLLAYQGITLDLSRTEYRLLLALLAQPGRVFSRAQLMDAAWDEPEASLERTVDTHVKSLRAKLRAVRAEPDPIRTHRGFGYSLNP